MSRLQAMTGLPSSSTALTRALRAMLIAVSGVIICAIAYNANRQIAQDIESQITHEERGLCLKFGLRTGAAYNSCMQDVSRLLQREQEIRSIEF